MYMYVCLFSIFKIVPVTNETKRIPERNPSLALNELVFSVDLPPLGFNTYFIRASGKNVYSVF